MSFSADDLTPLLTPPPDQQIRFGQATVLSWDPETFSNTISWRGVTFTDLPVLAGAEALSIQAGDTVGLLGWGTEAAAGSWWVLGRVVVPGTAKGTDAIAWMSTAIGRAVAAAVFAERVHFATVPMLEDTTSSSYTDLDTVGPEVTDVEIDAGTAIVMMAAWMDAETATGGDSLIGGDMAVEVRDAAGNLDGFTNPLHLSVSASGGSTDPGVAAARANIQVVPLDPDTYTFTAKYRRTNGSSPFPFNDRILVVIGL